MVDVHALAVWHGWEDELLLDGVFMFEGLEKLDDAWDGMTIAIDVGAGLNTNYTPMQSNDVTNQKQ